MKFLYLGAVGISSVVLHVARRQGLFERHGVAVQPVKVTGANVPELSAEHPMGLIGAPAALLNVAAGRPVRILASFNNGRLLHRLVVRPGIATPADLRGRRLGARVKGAAMWLHTVLALEQLGLDMVRDDIDILPIGDPVEVMRALEDGRIDGAVLSVTQSREMAARGFAVLLDLASHDLHGAPDALVATADVITEQAESVADVVAGLMEAAAFVLSAAGRSATIAAMRIDLGVSNDAAAEDGLAELAQVLTLAPAPSAERLCDMQRLMVLANPGVADVDVAGLIDDRFVRLVEAGKARGFAPGPHQGAAPLGSA